MSRLGKRTSGRHYEVAGCYVEILDSIESNARTEFTLLQDSTGQDVLWVDMVEELIAERVYRAEEEGREKDLECAKKLLTVCLSGDLQVDGKKSGDCSVARSTEQKRLWTES